MPVCPCEVLTTGTGTACLYVLVKCLLQAQGQRACMSLCSAYYRHRDSVPACPCAVLAPGTARDSVPVCPCEVLTTDTGTACLYVLVQCLLQAQGQRACRSL